MSFRIKDGLTQGTRNIIDANKNFTGSSYSVRTQYSSITPTLNLDFTKGVLDPRITFTRDSIGTYVGSDGYVKTATSGVARFDHDPVNGSPKGLLVEESRTNLLLNSDNLSAWTKIRSDVLSDTILSPDGTQNADKLYETVGTSNSYYAYQAVSLVSGTTYTFSFYAKAAERNFAWVRLYGTGTWGGVVFDLTTGATNYTPGITQTSTSTYVGNGWWRFTVTATSDLTGVNSPRIYVESENGAGAYDGVLGYGVYVWGVQLEEGTFATSYIPTTTTPVTRNAELVTISGTNFSSFYNQTEGTLLASWYDNQDTLSGVVSLNSGSLTNRMDIRRQSTTSVRSYFIKDGVSTTFYGVDSNLNVNTKHTAAIAYKLNAGVFCVDGISDINNNAPSVIPPVTHLQIGGLDNNASYLANSCISSIKYYNKRLSNTELINLTKV